MDKGIQLGGGLETDNSKGSSKFDSFLKNTKKILAFTLAETLIVMGVIGIVAALTIPNLNSSTGDMEKVAKVKKIYAELTQAHERATAVYGPIENWFVNDGCTKGSFTGNSACQNRYFDRIIEFMKVQKICNTGCMLELDDYGNGYKWPNGDYSGVSPNAKEAILANGIVMSVLYLQNPACDEESFGKNICGSIVVDIDGPNKGKSTWDFDVFRFYIAKEGIVPDGYYYSSGDENYNYDCQNEGQSTAWVIEKGNMDYLKAGYDDMKCPDGQPLTWERGSCK